MGGTRKLRCTLLNSVPLRSLLLSLFLLLGIVAGFLTSGRYSVSGADELRCYLDTYLAHSAAATISVGTVLRTVFCFFRAPLLAFLLGFALIGVVGVPLLFAAQGFVLSFSLFTFSAAIGRDAFLLLPTLFLLRLAVVLPCTFLLGTTAWDKARMLASCSLGAGKRVRPVIYGRAYWYRFLVCCVCLLIGSVLELLLVPTLLTHLGLIL